MIKVGQFLLALSPSLEACPTVEPLLIAFVNIRCVSTRYFVLTLLTVNRANSYSFPNTADIRGPSDINQAILNSLLCGEPRTLTCECNFPSVTTFSVFVSSKLLNNERHSRTWEL
jgi:hypothetical protein